MRILFLLVAFAALPLRSPHAVAAEEEPPEGVFKHFHWCDQAEELEDKLKRYEGFWSKHFPAEEDGYEDSVHVRYVRMCAYQLIRLYSALGMNEKIAESLDWLEKTDPELKIE